MSLQMTGPAHQFVREVPTPLPGTATYDVVVCGGTLGIFLACALQLKGLRYMLLLLRPPTHAPCVALCAHSPCTIHLCRVVLWIHLKVPMQHTDMSASGRAGWQWWNEDP